jgi:hypothetical protein
LVVSAYKSASPLLDSSVGYVGMLCQVSLVRFLLLQGTPWEVRAHIRAAHWRRRPAGGTEVTGMNTDPARDDDQSLEDSDRREQEAQASRRADRERQARRLLRASQLPALAPNRGKLGIGLAAASSAPANAHALALTVTTYSLEGVTTSPESLRTDTLSKHK